MQIQFLHIFAAIRPDRDVIGKQKNPRKRKFRYDSNANATTNIGASSSPSSQTNAAAHVDSNGSQQEDILLHFLMQIDHERSIEARKAAAVIESFDDDADDSSSYYENAALIGLVKIEPDAEISLYELFENRALLESYRKPVCAKKTKLLCV